MARIEMDCIKNLKKIGPFYQAGGAGSGVWTRGSMIAWEKKFGRVRLSTNALNINGWHSFRMDRSTFINMHFSKVISIF